MSISIKIEPQDPFLQQPAHQAPSVIPQLDQRVSNAQRDYLYRALIGDVTSEEAYKAGILSKVNHQLDAAIFNFSRAIFMDQTNHDYLYMRSLTYLQLGELASAIQDLEEIIDQVDKKRDLKLSGFEIQVVKEAASLHLQMRNYPAAISRTLKGLQQDPKSIDFLMLSAKIYAKLNSPDLAKGEINKILAIKPDHAEALAFAQTLVQRDPADLSASSTPIPNESIHTQSQSTTATKECLMQ